uniref:TLDc domain-containing protein n=1 Tax=Ditylum brightwellii TaxID=49249 RepID=A0A7S4VQB1_9STRA
MYRASHDGWRASNFHSKCDHQGPTLTVIRSTGGYIFGGFCDTAWSSNTNFKKLPYAFLYTLRCHSGLVPTKMRLKQRNDPNAVLHLASAGPITSFTRVGESYECPAGQTGKLFLTGHETFQASEVEVFSVQKKED